MPRDPALRYTPPPSLPSKRLASFATRFRLDTHASHRPSFGTATPQSHPAPVSTGQTKPCDHNHAGRARTQVGFLRTGHGWTRVLHASA